VIVHEKKSDFFHKASVGALQLHHLCRSMPGAGEKTRSDRKIVESEALEEISAENRSAEDPVAIAKHQSRIAI
jgi:hypothetical protein